LLAERLISTKLETLGKGPELPQTFTKPSVTEWIAKINKDLKGAKSANELQYHIEEGLSIDAIQAYQSTDLDPITRYRNHSLACHIDTSLSNCNENIKELLNIGVNTLILDTYSAVDYAVVLKDVILDYIEIVVNPMDETAEEKVMEYLTSQNADPKKIYRPNAKRNLIHIPFKNSISHQLSEMLDKVNNSSSIDLLIVVDAQKDFLSEIAKIRAAHILLTNLSKALDKKITYKLLSHTKASDEKVHELIQTSYMSLAAIIGEADGIASTVLDPKYQLNAFHTYNLITMESYLGKVKDPASGSNLIEKMTESLCQKSWSSFVENV